MTLDGAERVEVARRNIRNYISGFRYEPLLVFGKIFTRQTAQRWKDGSVYCTRQNDQIIFISFSSHPSIPAPSPISLSLSVPVRYTQCHVMVIILMA